MMKILRDGVGRFVLPLAVFVACGFTPWPASAQDPTRPESEEDWDLLGSFNGAAGGNLGQQVWNLLIEMENDGDLFQDLGALSLGLRVDVGDDARVDWDNYFTRRVYPMHDELPVGAELKAEHLSRYVDLQTVVSRGRVRYAYVPDIIDNHGIEFQIEGGTSLSMARARSPLPLGDRPLDEVLAERDTDDFRTLAEKFADDQREDLLILSAKGARGLTQWIANKFADRADTERATLFWESYADPMTLGFDLGVPVKVDLFSSSDNRLGPGDRVRHLTFIGISPVSMVLRQYGIRVEARYFFRYLRETTIIEEGDDKVLVTVRNVGSRGGELVPFKFRPEIRILSVFKLAYTFFEERWEKGRLASSELAYRVDLANPKGRASLAAFLDEGKSLTFHPLDQAAQEREGVEVLDWKSEAGEMRTGFRRAQFFTPFRYFNRKLTSTQKVRHEDIQYEELKIARNSQYKKKWGKDRNWRKQFLLQSLADPRLIGESSHEPRQAAAAVTLLTTYRDSYAEVDDLLRAAAGVEAMTGPHPALDAFVDMPSGETQRAFLNLELSLGLHHLGRIRQSSEDEAWEILAEVLLGPDHRSEWSSAEARDIWTRRGVRTAFAASHGEEVERRWVPGTRKLLDVHDRYRLAGRMIKKYRKVLELMVDGDCSSCAHSAFRKWKDVIMLQIVLYRLGALADGEEPGYHFEISTDRMMRPVTVTNNVRYEYMPDIDPTSAREIKLDKGLTAEQLQLDAREQKNDWFGRKNFLRPSEGRLRGGFLYARQTPDPRGEDYCLKLRIFTDYLVDPELSLRVDLREEHNKTPDITLKSSRFLLGEPEEIFQTPFRTARYYYDVPVLHVDTLVPDKAHTLLLRILNPDGYPVSEEQQIRFRSPEEGEARHGDGCLSGSEEEIVIPVEASTP